MKIEGQAGAMFVAATMQAGAHCHAAVARDAASGSAASLRRLSLAARCTARKPHKPPCVAARVSGRPRATRRVTRAYTAAHGHPRAPDRPRHRQAAA